MDFLKKKGKRKGWWLLLGVLVLLSVVPIGTMAVYTKFFSSDITEPVKVTGMTSPHPQDEKFDDTINLSAAPRILPRSYWLAQPPRQVLVNNTFPVHMVVVSDTRSEECYTSADCVTKVRSLQIYDMDSMKFDDISANFVVGGDGNVYEGRGWVNQGAHSKGYNTGSLGVSLIGTFSQTLPKDVQVEAFDKLVAIGVETGKIAANYTLVNHCQLRTDGYFDLALAKNMTSWPHFDSSFPISRCALA